MKRGLLLGCALVLLAGVAAADSEEIVTLHDGSVYRGVLVELVKDDHVTLKLATGEVRKFAWSDIDKTQSVDLPAPVTVTAPPAPMVPPVPEVTVTVNAVSTSPVILQHRTGSISVPGGREASVWTDACTAPCDVGVPGGLYRLGGPGVAPTKPFELPDHGKARIDATLGTSGGRAVGLALTLTGAGFLLISASLGLGVAVLAAVSNNNFSLTFTTEEAIYGVVAGISGGLGLLVLIPGLVVLLNNGSNATVVQLARAVTTGLRF